MGETDDDIVDVAQSLRDVGSDSVPVNFLIPIHGTPLAGRWSLTPMRCLRILSLMRLTMPQSELRIAGGREHHLRSLQPMGLLVANSIFIGDYLTAKGTAPGRRRGDDPRPRFRDPRRHRRSRPTAPLPVALKSSASASDRRRHRDATRPSAAESNA